MIVRSLINADSLDGRVRINQTATILTCYILDNLDSTVKNEFFFDTTSLRCVRYIRKERGGLFCVHVYKNQADSIYQEKYLFINHLCFPLSLIWYRISIVLRHI